MAIKGRHALLAARVLMALVFLIEGADKFSNSHLWIRTFNEIGFGQWFRYFTGVVEVVGAVLLLVPQTAWIGAAALLCTMIGALVVHFFVIGTGRQTVAVVVLGSILTAVAIGSRQRRA
jgi:putative oxidoreductase